MFDSSTETLVNGEIYDNKIETLLNNDGITEMLMVIILVVMGLFLLIAFIINSYIPFRQEIARIKIEMASAFDEDEYLYWKKELKKLYMRKIPIISLFTKR